MVPAEEAKEITWGGAAACEDCKFLKKNAEQEFGVKLGESCYQNRNAGGECKYPQPLTLPCHGPLWRILRDARHSVIPGGMDGVPSGFAAKDLEALARAHGEPFDSVFIERFGVLADAWILQVRKRSDKASSSKR